MKNIIIAGVISLLPITLISTLYKSSGQENNSEKYTHKVISVVDGDTITVSPGVNGEHHIRYLGIDTPEYGEPYSRVAKNFNRKLVSRKYVRIETLTKALGYYYRVLGIIYVKNGDETTFVNKMIVSEGLAWIYPRDINGTTLLDELIKAQTRAISEKKNIWSRIDLEHEAFKDKKIPIFHTKTKCSRQTGETPMTIKQAFSELLTPCRKCRKGLWK